MRWRNRATFIAFRMLVDYFGNRLTRAVRTAQRDLVRQLGRDAVGEEFLLFFAYCLCQCVAGAQEDIKQDPLPKRRAWGLRRVRRLLETADWRQVAQRLLEHHAQGPWPPHRQEDCWCHKPMASWVTASKRLHEVGHGWPGFRS